MSQTQLAAPATITIAERRSRALALRRAGHGYDRIADQLRGQAGISARYSGAQAYRDVVTELRRMMAANEETASEILVLDLARLDELISVLWPRVQAGDLGAMDRLLGVLDRRARYLGLTNPTPITLQASGNVAIGGTQQNLTITQQQISEMQQIAQMSADELEAYIAALQATNAEIASVFALFEEPDRADS